MRSPLEAIATFGCSVATILATSKTREHVDREKRTTVFGILAGLWMVGLITAGILYREYVLRTGSEPPMPPPRPSTPLRPPPEPVIEESQDEPQRRVPRVTEESTPAANERS